MSDHDTQPVRITWKNGTPKVYVDGNDITGSIMAGGLSVDFPDTVQDGHVTVTLTLAVSDLDVDVDAVVSA